MRVRCASHCVLGVCVAVSALTGTWVRGEVYYVSPNGDDSNSGLDPASAWRTVAKVNATRFAPGSQILFEGGGGWRESLIASSSGAPGQPITYDAYGSGEKPRFWGSNLLDKSLFQPIAGSNSAFYLSTPSEINSVLLDHQFTHSAPLLTNSADPQTNIDYVNNNPGTWYYADNKLYLNTGVNPATDPRTYTAAVREDVVYSNSKDHLVFRNLIADESARYNSGYAFRVQNSNDVLIEASEAYHAGKHHFGVINSTNFVGRNLYTSSAMPDQGYGGASAYVSYSDDSRIGDTSSWIDTVAENPNGPYPGFITHGQGMGQLLIRNMTVRGGAGMGIYAEGANETVRVEGGTIENGPMSISGNNITIDGTTLSGPYGSIGIAGNNNVVQNTLIVGRGVNYWAGHPAAITDSGTNNTIRFNTISLGAIDGGGGASIGIMTPLTNSLIYGNVLTDRHSIMLYGGQAPIEGHENLFSADAVFGMIQSDSSVSYYQLPQWQQLGYEKRLAIPGDADFDGDVDADDYALIDQGFASRNQFAGFHNGDFNLSGGPPDADDYFLIDHAFSNQATGQLSMQRTALPEPSLALILSGLICLPSRTMRQRRAA